MTELFGVVLWFPDGSYHWEGKELEAEAAVKLAKECTERPAAVAGLIDKVTIVDEDDCTNFMWEFGKGITYPELGESVMTQDTNTGRAISELAALLRKECPLDQLLGAVRKTEGNPINGTQLKDAWREMASRRLGWQE